MEKSENMVTVSNAISYKLTTKYDTLVKIIVEHDVEGKNMSLSIMGDFGTYSHWWKISRDWRTFIMDIDYYYFFKKVDPTSHGEVVNVSKTIAEVKGTLDAELREYFSDNEKAKKEHQKLSSIINDFSMFHSDAEEKFYQTLNYFDDAFVDGICYVKDKDPQCLNLWDLMNDVWFPYLLKEKKKIEMDEEWIRKYKKIYNGVSND